MNRVGTEYNDFCIISGEPVIGEETWVGYFTLLDGTGGLTIGKHCSISSGVHIYTHDAVRWSVLGLEKDREGGSHLDRAPVTIGDNVFIGANTVVRKGVTIGEQSIIGAGSVVTKDIPPRSVAVGSPATVIGTVEIVNGELRTTRAPTAR